MAAIDRERWFRLTFIEQMGNIGSEVGRCINAYRIGDSVRFEAAMARALDLFDATDEAARHDPNNAHRAQEIAHAREQFLDLFSDPDGLLDETAAASLDQNFFQFALAARRGR